MLRRKAFNRIFISTLVFFVIIILYSINKVSNNVEHDIFNGNSYIYSLNNDNYVSKASIYVSKNISIEEKIKQKLNAIIEDNNKNVLLPSYINPIIPKNTKVEKVLINDGIVKVYFSKELLNISDIWSEKMIESIIYTITDENILGVEIYVDGSILKYVPNTNKKIKGTLTRDFGINKVYEVVSVSDIVKVVMNYYGKDGNNYYSIPVTKYVNSNKEKLEIIIDEYNSFNDLISFVDNISLLDYKFKDNTLIINLVSNDLNNFDELFDSLFDNYDVDKIIIYNDNQKKVEKNRKDIEN